MTLLGDILFPSALKAMRIHQGKINEQQVKKAITNNVPFQAS